MAETEEGEARDNTLYIEGRIQHQGDVSIIEFAKQLSKVIQSSNMTCDLGEDLLCHESVSRILQEVYEEAKANLDFLKTIEYVGEEPHPRKFLVKDVNIKVQLYQPYPLSRESSKIEVPNSETTLLPHDRFEGLWEKLVFNSDVKGALLRMVTMARFLATRDHAASSPLILLHGRPGTGKTTLCRALAQKISIRMSTEYPVAKLIELHSAQLMSKFFSESGRQVQDVFETIYRLCKKHDNTFFCIFIDEVDTIARSREVAAANNEVTDSQRVTGEILKGIDNLKEFFNFVMVATTNLHEHLDEAFLSRCAYIHAMEEPGQAAQYEILAGQLRSYMNNKIVVPRVLIPTYQTAVASVSQTQTESAGSKLLKLLDVIQALSNDTRLGWENSGRTLCNLVSTAFKIYGRPRPATVDEVFSYIHRYLEIQRKRHRETSVQHQNDDDDESEHTIEYRCKKTKHRITINWDGTFNEAAFRRSKAEAESAVFGMSRDTAIRIEEDVKQGKMTLKESVTQLYRDNKRNAEREASEARVEHAQKATDSENQGPEAETESTANNEQQHTVKAHADGLEKENDFMHVAAEDVEEDDNVLLLD